MDTPHKHLLSSLPSSLRVLLHLGAEGGVDRHALSESAGRGVRT